MNHNIKRLNSFLVLAYDENENLIVATQQRFSTAYDAQHWIDALSAPSQNEFVAQALDTDKI